MNRLEWMFITPDNIDSKISNTKVDIKRHGKMCLTTNGKKYYKHWRRLQDSEERLGELEHLKEHSKYYKAKK